MNKYIDTPEWMTERTKDGSQYFICQQCAGTGKIKGLIFDKMCPGCNGRGRNWQSAPVHIGEYEPKWGRID